VVSSSKHILLHEGRVSCEQIHMHHCCIPPAAFLPATRTPPPTNMSLCSLSVISSINSLSIVSSFPCTNAAFLLQHSCQPQAHLFPPTHACGTQKHSFFKTRQAMIHLCVCVFVCVGCRILLTASVCAQQFTTARATIYKGSNFTATIQQPYRKDRYKKRNVRNQDGI
jgi:hypothetical protein